ncbi:NLR family CARD domain-containing protein 3-like [Acropora millepora]|uniref:NLR family CARD domain-containing protein 3-like n=1 Tax=Acropora millepora TaxID=45264 RepID=UPI001CF0E043|nr:NLR family CARD domain-containing protein 3-like [Acropora millepora]
MASCSRQPQEHDRTIKVTILASEWGSSKGGLSTINRELAIQLAKYYDCKVTFFLLKCSHENKEEARCHNVSIVEAERKPGYEELDWLSFPPQDLQIDIVIGHGVKLGKQAQVIRKYHKCKWIQVVHTDPEKLGMFKCYENPISKGEQKHHVEVELCQMADLVVGVGPKLTEAFRRYLRWCKKDQDVLEFTPSVFTDFARVQQALEERKPRSVLIFGRGDDEDFELKGYDIAARSVAAVLDTDLVFVGAPDGKEQEIAKRLLDSGISKGRLTVRGFKDREALKQLFCEVDLVLMPSRTEGFGLTGLEALSAGLPVIVSKNSGFGEALGSVPFGSSFVIDSEDPSAWTAAIKGIWNKDRQTRLDETKVLRESYEKRYGWSEQCANLIEKMVNLLENRQDASGRRHMSVHDLRESRDASIEDRRGESCLFEMTLIVVLLEYYYASGRRHMSVHDLRESRDASIEDRRDASGRRHMSVHDLRESRDASIEDRRDASGRRHMSVHDLRESRDASIEDRRDASGRRHMSLQDLRERRGASIEDRRGFSSARNGLFRLWRRFVFRKKARMFQPRHIIRWIQQIYAKREGVILPLPWCVSFSFQLENIYTRLRIVAKENTCREVTHEVTSMTGIFTPHKDCQRPKVVLIEGEPGMGKTTYCRKLAYDWATRQGRKWDESFPRVEVLLLLRCREIKSSIWEAIDEQILPEDIEPEVRDMFIQFLRENPSKVLLVLDGLDEADPEKLTLFRKLVQKEKLPGCFIVLTSRHEAGSKIRPYTDTLLEIEGFTRTDAKCFIRKYFRYSGNKRLAKGLIARLSLESLSELTRNPLNTLLLCVIFEHLNGALPNSRTKLYTEIVRFVLRRYENKNGLSNSDENLLLFHKKELMILGKMAQDSLQKGELYFEDNRGDLKESLLGKFGFVSIQVGGTKIAPCPRYVFFHKSFQEFLSAFFLAFSIIDGTMDCKSVANKEYETKLSQVFTYMSGIVAMYSKETAVSIVKSIASVVNASGHISRVYLTHLSLALRFINECKLFSETLYTELAHLFGKSLYLVDMKFELLRNFCNGSFETLFMALSVNTSLTSLNLSENDICAKAANSLSEALSVNTSLTSLNLSENDICAKAANSLSEALRVNTSLTSLNLYWNSIGDEGANSLSQALRVNTSLTSLNLSKNSIGYEAANSLYQALRVNTNLTSLNLCKNTIGDEGAKPLSQALRINTSLTSLDFACNSIGYEGANSLSQALKVNTSLTSLNFAVNSIADEGANSLSEALIVNASLTFLNLSSTSIGYEGANFLSQALKVNTSLISLNLSSNSIGDKGANSLCQALRVNISLTSLNLSEIYSGDEGAYSLSQALRVNTALSSLDFACNSIGDEAANSLSQALRENTSLSSLNLSHNSITCEGANSLSQALRVNTSLASLNLSGNYIGGKGAKSLSEALRVNTSLTSLDFGCNSIGDEGANSLSQALRVNTSLTSLNLSRNSIGYEGTNTLSQALRVNTSLTSLNLSQNSIGYEGANSLSQALRVNTSLTSLDLSDNTIGGEGANSLSEALRVNTCLTSLRLTLNDIGDEAANSLSQALKVNASHHI